MKKFLCLILSLTILFSFSSCKNNNTPIEPSNTVESDTVNSNNEALDENKELSLLYGEKVTLQGTMIKNNSSPIGYSLKLNDVYNITIKDGDLTENFECETVNFYAETEANGNYNFENLIDKSCVVTASLENYRGAGELYFLNPTIKVDGVEAEKNKSINKKYSTAPLLAEGEYILPESFDINGRVSLDKVSYGYTEGNVPKDPYRLSLTLKPTKNNWYFIHRIYMDVLIFDENDEQIKSYHTEYAGHELSKNQQVIENLGFDNLNPMNQGYHIKENWSDFPSNAYSAAILISFDVFAKIEFGIYSNGNNVTVAPYELRYVEPQVFDSYVDINNGRVFEHR